jgi:WD40 repeat protein
MAFTGDGNVLVTGCGDANIRAFDVETGERLLLLSGHTNGSVADYSFHPTAKRWRAAAWIRRFAYGMSPNLKNATLLATLEAHTPLVFGVAISPHGQWLASAGWDNKVKARDLAAARELWFQP